MAEEGKDVEQQADDFTIALEEYHNSLGELDRLRNQKFRKTLSKISLFFWDRVSKEITAELGVWRKESRIYDLLKQKEGYYPLTDITYKLFRSFEGGEHMWPGDFEVKVLSNTEQLTLDEWAKNYKIESAAEANLARVTGDTTLSGKLAKMLSIFSFDRHETAIATIFKGNVYHLRFDSENPNDPEFERHKEIYNQMTSSFKFLE